MTESDENEAKVQKHYAVAVWNATPTKIKCSCGAIFQGHDAINQQQEHMNVQDLMTGLEQELERRNVFDQNDNDEENP